MSADQTQFVSEDQIICQPYDWRQCDIDNAFMIKIWGHTLNNGTTERVLLKVNNFRPFCRLELQSTYNENTFNWEGLPSQMYIKWLKNTLGDHAPTDGYFGYSKKLYTYKEVPVENEVIDSKGRNEIEYSSDDRNSKYPILLLYFETEEALKHCINFINKDAYVIKELSKDIPIRGKIWETNIDQIHKMNTHLKINYGQWLRCKASKVSMIDRISDADHEYTVNFLDIEGVSSKESAKWIVNPIVMALDIEARSKNPLTMPKATHSEDVITMISLIIQRLNPIKGEFGTPDGIKRILLVNGICRDIKNAEVIRFPNQMDLLYSLGEIFKKYDPTVMTGYNIYRFDLPYMNTKFESFRDSWPNCSALKNDYANTRVNTKTWSSSAYGFMNISTLEAEGRICIDMYPIIRRDHKLEKYTLDFVSKYFLKRGKHDISARQMFKIYDELCEAMASGDPALMEKAAEANALVGEYCLEDSILCIDLMIKLNTYISLIENANIVKVTMMDIFTRGQQIRVQNQVYYYAYHDGYILDERKLVNEKFAGGYVVPPIPGRYKNVFILDFASLYPSIIRAYNICYTTLVDDYSTIPDEKCNVLRWEETVMDGKDKGQIRKFYVRFIKKEYKR